MQNHMMTIFSIKLIYMLKIQFHIVKGIDISTGKTHIKFENKKCNT